MERIVYLIGAGFSAPLGIPVMSNFLMKSKDMYFLEEEKFTHFSDVFKTIATMSKVKNYYSADLFNIEEILSILEMQEHLDEGDVECFKKYISDVIQYYTPMIEKYTKKYPANWYDFIFGVNHLFRKYGYFIGNILNLEMYKDQEREIWCTSTYNPQHKYSIISLNYDLIFENIVEYLKNNFNQKGKLDLKYNLKKEFDPNFVYLAKIHGCAKQGNIVPPTWNKNSNPDLLSTWKLAKKLLEEANHIRILGYSLPVSDSYIKYLLKASILNSSHLKTIDVITLDFEGNVKKRYDEFIEFNYYQFRNRDINEYFEMNLEVHLNKIRAKPWNEVKLSHLEEAHGLFMSK